MEKQWLERGSPRMFSTCGQLHPGLNNHQGQLRNMEGIRVSATFIHETAVGKGMFFIFCRHKLIERGQQSMKLQGLGDIT